MNADTRTVRAPRNAAPAPAPMVAIDCYQAIQHLSLAKVAALLAATVQL